MNAITYDITNSPSVIQRSDDQDELTDHVDQETCGGEDQIGDEQSNRFRILESSKVFESGDGDEEADTPDDKGGQPKELRDVDGRVRLILV
jgi:hypothetical protein